jgi:hypothetical protein
MRPSFIPKDLAGKALFDFLVKNEQLIINAKKSVIKEADAAYSAPLYVNSRGAIVDKADDQGSVIDPSKLRVVPIINTTNWLDSHGDVHIPGLWKKTISDNKKSGFLLLKSHIRDFEAIIAEGCQGQAKQMSWKELGLDYSGVTEALLFIAIVEQDRNPYMFEQYQKGRVKQHSVGMRYMKILTCINDDDYPVQKENWDKYIEMVVNRDEAEEDGYFWAVLEAQIVEGSAVVFGSNVNTPTYSINILGTKTEPPPGTPNEPPRNNKSIIGCPTCDYLFVAGSDTAATNCPNCGQYVSPQSTTIMLSEPAFDLKKAIEQTTFINI